MVKALARLYLDGKPHVYLMIVLIKHCVPGLLVSQSVDVGSTPTKDTVQGIICRLVRKHRLRLTCIFPLILFFCPRLNSYK